MIGRSLFPLVVEPGPSRGLCHPLVEGSEPMHFDFRMIEGGSTQLVKHTEQKHNVNAHVLHPLSFFFLHNYPYGSLPLLKSKYISKNLFLYSVLVSLNEFPVDDSQIPTWRVIFQRKYDSLPMESCRVLEEILKIKQKGKTIVDDNNISGKANRNLYDGCLFMDATRVAEFFLYHKIIFNRVKQWVFRVIDQVAKGMSPTILFGRWGIRSRIL